MPHPIDELRYGVVDQAYVARMAAVPAADDGPVLMLNLMRYRPWADYRDGRDEPPVTGREADDRYAPLTVLADLGAEVVLFGDVVEQVRGDEGWDRVAVVRYPTRQSFLAMQDRPDFVALHVHKDAGMERTVIAACHDAVGTLGAGERLLVDLVGGAVPDPEPGQLVLRVDGVPVGDGRAWTALVVTPVDGDVAVRAHPADPATTVVVLPLLDGLR